MRVLILVKILICVLITYFWLWGSHLYINISRSYAASSFPGDITFTQKIIYQSFFSATVFIILLVFVYSFYLMFKNKIAVLTSQKKAVYIIFMPLICVIYTFIDIYFFLFVN